MLKKFRKMYKKCAKMFFSVGDTEIEKKTVEIVNKFYKKDFKTLDEVCDEMTDEQIDFMVGQLVWEEEMKQSGLLDERKTTPT